MSGLPRENPPVAKASEGFVLEEHPLTAHAFLFPLTLLRHLPLHHLKLPGPNVLPAIGIHHQQLQDVLPWLEPIQLEAAMG